VKRLQRLFPALKVERFAEAQEASELTGGGDTLAALARRLRAARPGKPLPALWRDVYDWYGSQQGWQQELARITQGLSFVPHQERLLAETRQALYGEIIQSSVSRLEKFNACPFAYFAAYGLGLKPRSIYEITALEHGDIIHRALAELSRLLDKGGPSWQELDEIRAKELVTRVLAGVLPGFLSGIMGSTARYRYQATRLQDTLTATLMLMAEHVRRGGFKAVAWELSFGSREGDALPPLVLELQGGRKLEINGQIDRVDIGRSAEAVYARVIDYKSGKQTLAADDIASGLRLQLAVYLETVLNNPGFFKARALAPAGLYYMTVRDELLSGPMPPAGEESSFAGLRLSGLTIKDATAVHLADPQIKGHSKLIPAALSANGFYANSPGLPAEEFRELRERLKDVLRETARNMAQGITSVDPRRSAKFDACAYCDYAAFCGFDGEIVRA
jgi:ATP-dependent helicase/nuclease subunit B